MELNSAKRNSSIMVKSLIVQILVFFIAFTALAEDTRFNLIGVSQLPIHAYEHDEAKANMVAIIGGKGMKNPLGKSRNFLVVNKSKFTNSKLNYYLFPNWSKSEKAGYKLRVSRKRVGRILSLLKGIRKRNSLPNYLVGFSRGSVDAAAFAKIYPEKIRGIVLASGIYKNSSRKAELYSMDRLIGSKINTAVLVVHHKKDACHVTQFSYAEVFYQNLHAPRKQALFFNGGVPTGRTCGPLHYHGFENIEEKVASDIAEWIRTDSVK